MNIKRKKILRITTVSHSLDLLLKGQLKYIGENGYDVCVACSKDDKVSAIEEREKVKYYKLELTRTLNPFKDLVSLFKAIKLILRLRPDIVHTHSPKAGIVGMMASWICRVPLRVHTVAGLPLTEASGLKKKVLVAVERITYMCSNFVLPNSIKQKDYILDKIYNHPKVEVIGKGSSNGIDLEYFSPSEKIEEEVKVLNDKFGITKSNIVLCFVGRLTNYKGVNELVLAFNTLNEKHPSLKLLLVGPYEDINPLLPEVLDIIKENKNIFDVGHQSDIRPYLCAADIFIFPSYREGFPQSLMQAAAMNLACIASDINGCNEIIDNRKTGLLINPKSIAEIETSVEELIINTELRLLLASNARKLMEQEYDQKIFWKKILNFYNTNFRNE